MRLMSTLPFDVFQSEYWAVRVDSPVAELAHWFQSITSNIECEKQRSQKDYKQLFGRTLVLNMVAICAKLSDIMNDDAVALKNRVIGLLAAIDVRLEQLLRRADVELWFPVAEDILQDYDDVNWASSTALDELLEKIGLL